MTYATGTINSREVTTKDSVYDLLNPTPSAPMKTRFVDGFCGDSLDTFVWGRATSSTATGGTCVMTDEVDGGIKLTTGTASYGQMWITFQTEQLNGGESQASQQPFSSRGSVMISTVRMTTDSLLTVFSSAGGVLSGGTESGRGDANGNAGDGCIGWQMRGNQTYWNLVTNDAGTYGAYLNTGVKLDHLWHNHKVECKPTSAEYTLDGVLVGSRTDNLTKYHLAPLFGIFKYTVAGNCGMQVRYCEAYNT